MPVSLIVDRTLPVIASRFPLAAALLSSWEHYGFLLGSLSEDDCWRIDEARTRLGLPSAICL